MKIKKSIALLLAIMLAAAVALPIAQAPARAQGPEDGGTLRLWASWPRHFNVFTITSGRQANVFNLIYSGLIRINYNVEGYVNDLAESYEASDDMTEFTFNLREGVTWHDGEPFSAEDVVFTFTQALNPATGTVWQTKLSGIEGAEAFSTGEADTVSGIQMVDDNTVTFVLSEPNAAFLDTVALISIAPQHILADVDPASYAEHEQFLSNPIGTGPFMLTDAQENEFFELTRNEDFYKGAPHLERIIGVQLAPDTALAAFERGDLDVTLLFSPEAIDRARTLDGAAVYAKPTLFVEALFLNVRNDYLADPRVRQAMLMAIDRDIIANEVLGGSKLPLEWPTPILQPWVGFSPNLDEKWEYNPDRARELLEEAGWDFDRVLRWTGQLSEPLPEMLAIQQFLGDVGIKTEFELVADAAAQNEIRWVTQEWDINYSGLAIGTDPDEMTVRLGCGMEYPAGFNDGYCNPEVDALLEQARQSVDLEARAALYQELQEVLIDELPILPLFRRVRYEVASEAFHDPARGETFDAGHLTLYAPAHEWWLEQ